MSNAVPEGWDDLTFGDVFSRFSSGMTPSRLRPDYFHGDILWVTSGELNYNKIVDTKEKITLEAAQDTGLKVYPKGTFFIAITGLEAAGTRGRCAVLAKEATVNQSCMAFEPVERVDTDYLYQYYLMHGTAFAFKFSQGTKQQSFNSSIVKDFPLLLPPLPEQKKIAAILSSVDDVIEKTRAQIDKLKDLKTGMMQELLTKGIGHTAFKDSPVGRIPEGWEVCTLGDVTEESAFGPRFSSDFYSEIGRIGCIRTTDIDENWDIDYSTVPLADLKYEDFESHFLKDGDLLVTRSGTCGVVDVFKEQPVPMVAAAFLIRFRLSRKVNPWFIRYAMMSADIQESVQMLASGGVQKNLSGTNLKTLLLPLPSESEQDKIVECIRSVSDKLAQVESRRRQLDLIKKALMQDLLTGKVRVNVDNKETAVA